MNFDQTMRKAQQLEELAGELERLARNSMENSMQAVSRAWTGDAANAYLNKARTLEGKINGSATQLRAIAGSLRHVAQVTYNAEMTAYIIAMQRQV